MFLLAITFGEWLFEGQPDLLPRKDCYIILENALARYFVHNQDRILQVRYIKKDPDQPFDLVSATDQTLKQDIQEPRKNHDHLLDLENWLQYCIATQKACESGSVRPTEKDISLHMAGLSIEFRNHYRSYMGLYEQILTQYSPQAFQSLFIKLTKKTA